MAQSEAKQGLATDKKVIIIGSGCTGCALAQGLKKAGIPTIIYEARTSSSSVREWTMGLYWALPTLKALLPPRHFTKLQSAQADPVYTTSLQETLPFLNGATGETLNAFTTDYMYRVNRYRLRNLLADGLEIREGKVLQNITYSSDEKTVTAQFSDGSEDTGCMIIGADGPTSSTRSLLLGTEPAQPKTLNYAFTMCFTTYSRAKALWLRSPPHHSLFQVAPHPAGLFAVLGLHDAPDPDKPENWVFFHYISFPEPAIFRNTRTRAQHIAYQKILAPHFAEPIRSAFEWMPPDHESVWYGKLNHWDPCEDGHRWDNHSGRITLAGDAAHPMTFQRGQGLNHALTDSLRLCEAIQKLWRWNDREGNESSGGSVERRMALVGAYEKEMVARGGEEVRLSAKTTVMLHDWKQVLQSPITKMGVKPSTPLKADC